MSLSSNVSSSLLTAYLPAKLQPFVTISYPVWGVENGHRVQLYKKGRNDVHFVIFMTAAFTVLRHLTMTYVLSPIAHRYVQVSGKSGNTKPITAHERRTMARKRQHAASRFAEQGWSLLYCLVMESMGLVSTEQSCWRVAPWGVSNIEETLPT